MKSTFFNDCVAMKNKMTSTSIISASDLICAKVPIVLLLLHYQYKSQHVNRQCPKKFSSYGPYFENYCIRVTQLFLMYFSVHIKC